MFTVSDIQKNCLDSSEYFNFHLNVKDKFQPHVARLLEVPVSVVNKALSIWNPFDPQIKGCFTVKTTDGWFEKETVWKAEIWNAQNNLLQQQTGKCTSFSNRASNIEPGWFCKKALKDIESKFSDTFDQTVRNRMKESLTNLSWKILGGTVAAACFYKAYQWHSEEKPLKRNIALLTGIISTLAAIRG